MTWDREGLDGVDVSCWQPETNEQTHKSIDWDKARDAGVRFVVGRASFIDGGTFHTDPEFPKHARILADKGLDFTAYHYFSPFKDEQRTRDEAKRFVDVVGKVKITLAPACDLETRGRDPGLDAQAIAESTECFLDVVDTLTGKKTILYVGPFFMRDNIREECGRFSSRLLWQPQYGSSSPMIPKPFLEASIWQARGDDGRVDGIPGACDRNVLAAGVTLDNLRNGVPPKVLPDLTTTRGVQQGLRFLGYDVGDFIDGKFGASTRAAIAAFQRASKLSQDGIAGDNTIAALEDALRPYELVA